MMHPVTKAKNAAARHQYYGFLSEKQFPPQSKGYGNASGGAGVPAKPKTPMPSLPMKAVR